MSPGGQSEATTARDSGRKAFQRRVRVLMMIMAGALAGVALRAFQLQVVQYGRFEKLSRGQYLNDVKVMASRGEITDRSGKPLAISVDAPSVYANPPEVTDPRGEARKLANLLKLDLDQTYQRLASERYFVWLGRQIAPETAKAVADLALPGIGIAKEPRRFYPNLTIAANVVGFAGIESKGLEGIERQLDEALAGEPHVAHAVRDARGRTMLSEGLDAESARGADVKLSLDLNIQHAAQDALAEALKEYDAQSGIAVVLDVQSADVLALATEPTFNPNTAQQAAKSRLRNRPVTDVFEPGSSMKPFIIAAALDAGVVDKSTTVFCENGEMKLGAHIIHDVEKNGTLTLTGILQHSSNIGAAKVGTLLGRDRLANLFSGLGFGQRTGIELPGESPGLMRAATTWSTINIATQSYGHGIAVTALQLAAGYRALAADGIYKAPRLVREVKYADGRTMKLRGADEHRVFKSSSVRLLLPMLEAVVGDQGTAPLARVSGYRVAGKTGTSTKIDPVAGGYSNDRYTASFAGFLPAEAPRVVIAVVLDEPMKMHHGGEVAGPVFSRIGEVAMRALGVVPSALFVADKPVSAPAVAEGTDTPTLVSTAAVATAMEKGKVPSFLGLTAREAMDRYSDSQLHADLQLEGSGRVVRQSPLPGAADDTTKRLHLTLATQAGD